MRSMTTSTVLSILLDLRPQAYGSTSPSKIANPVIEPLWDGIRVLAAVHRDGSAIRDDEGDLIDDLPEIDDALRASVAADELIVDGILTKQVSHDGVGVYIGAEPIPNTGSLIAQTMVGTRRNRTAEAAASLERQRKAQIFGPDDAITFVALDLLHLDGDPLLGVPLLERKRLLEAVIVESDLVRRGAYIRPPIETWVNSWRSIGFAGLTYKAANGRYRPGGVKDDWATSAMPRR
jgi:ATP-dependent DNA ligase